MNNYFIQKIIIKDIMDIKNIEIILDKNKRKHLIITGKNGSGKTTTLIEINNLLNKLINNGLERLNKNLKVSLIFSNYNELYQDIINGKFILAYFEAKRENQPIVPIYIENVKLNQKNGTETKNIHKKFISYMVRLRNKLLNEKFDGNIKEAEKIQKWFNNFENLLKELFSENELRLKYYNDELNFKIEYKDKSFGLNELSDGYSSLLAILTELILRMEAHNVSTYDMQGVILIDEIETHLHVDLQKKVLPFLISFFPNIQFIVTTHSPFVLQSIENSVVFDLERKEQLSGETLSKASYVDIVKNYFEVDSQFSQILENDIKRYENLVELFEKNSLTIKEEKELLELDIRLDKISPMLSDSIYLRFKEAQDRISENG